MPRKTIAEDHAEQQIVDHQPGLAADQLERRAFLERARRAGRTRRTPRRRRWRAARAGRCRAADRPRKRGPRSGCPSGPGRCRPSTSRRRSPRASSSTPCSASARGQHVDRMEQRGRRQPRHQRGVLDRVPEPPAAPAQLVIGPVAARGDARASAGSRPPSTHGRIARASARIDFAGQQRADGEAERDRQADIAEVKRRRMEGQAGVLEQRVEAPALERRRDRAARTGSRRAAGRRRSRAPARACAPSAAISVRSARSAARTAPATAPGERQHRDPQQHRAFVVPPRAGDLVDERLGAVAVVERPARPTGRCARTPAAASRRRAASAAPWTTATARIGRATVDRRCASAATVSSS